MDEYELLDLSVEELMSTAKEIHKFECSGEWQRQVDFEFEIISETYEDGISQVAEKLATDGYPVPVYYSTYYTIQLPIKDEDGVWRLLNFNSIDENIITGHKYSSSFQISKHPVFIAKQKEIAELEKKKKEDEIRADKLRLKQQEMKIYEKVKRELENNG